jgi:hypothetical protein
LPKAFVDLNLIDWRHMIGSTAVCGLARAAAAKGESQEALGEAAPDFRAKSTPASDQ